MRLAALILLLIAMWTFSIGVENVNGFKPTGDDASAKSQTFLYAIGSFALPTLALGGAWFCWRKSLQTNDTPTNKPLDK